jgi:hypothetical protein
MVIDVPKIEISENRWESKGGNGVENHNRVTQRETQEKKIHGGLELGLEEH